VDVRENKENENEENCITTNFIICFLHHIKSGDLMKGNGKAGLCVSNRGNDKCIQISVGKHEG
jgi:hypothetical protein